MRGRRLEGIRGDSWGLEENGPHSPSQSSHSRPQEPTKTRNPAESKRAREAKENRQTRNTFRARRAVELALASIGASDNRVSAPSI